MRFRLCVLAVLTVTASVLTVNIGGGWCMTAEEFQCYSGCAVPCVEDAMNHCTGDDCHDENVVKQFIRQCDAKCKTQCHIVSTASCLGTGSRRICMDLCIKRVGQCTEKKSVCDDAFVDCVKNCPQ